MYRKIVFFLALNLLIGCTLCSCAPNSITPSTAGNDLPPSVLSEFENYVPNATVYKHLICDLNKDGTDDYILLFSAKTAAKPIVAGLSVCLGNSAWSAIDLASDTDFVFCSDPSVLFDNNTPIISLYLKEPSSDVKYFYEVAYSYDSENRGTNYSIRSKRIEKENTFG